jgi:hypothetical protein
MTVQPADSLDFSICAAPAERRRAKRFRFDVVMPAVFGRGNAMILDVSADGARVMHYAAQPLRSQVRLVFAYGGRRFAVTASVLAMRVVGLGDGPSGETSFESRMRFLDCTPEMAQTLSRIIAQIDSERLRTWHSNLSGDEAGDAQPMPEDDVQYFMRCRFLGQRWVKCWTRIPEQPEDGFTVPAKLSDGEVTLLCEAYETMDSDGRGLIRATARLAA